MGNLRIVGPACPKCGVPMQKSDASTEVEMMFECESCRHTFKRRRKVYQRPVRPFRRGPDSAA